MDVWILSSKESDFALLSPIGNNANKRCCWDGDMQNSFTGFIRVIEYHSSDGTNIEYASQMWEGEVTNGIPDGFIR